MKLRTQLIVVSLFALCLPWAGASFIYEMEAVLRSGQQDTLATIRQSRRVNTAFVAECRILSISSFTDESFSINVSDDGT